MKKDINDFDLDTINALDDFPENNEDSYLYLRGRFDGSRILPGFVLCCGTNECVATSLVAFMGLGDEQRDIVFSAVLSYLQYCDKEEKDLFLKYVK